MAARLTLAAFVLALLTVGCGGTAPNERARVAAYITRVSEIETALDIPLATVTRTAGAFVAERARRPSRRTRAQERALLASGVQIAARAHELASLPAPGPAAHLRALLLELAGTQVGMTHELAQLVAFQPRFDAALTPLAAATIRLENVLLQQQALGPAGVAAVYAAKAAALRQFRATIDRILPRLRRLTPPAVSRPSYDTERAALAGMASSAGRLASALAAGAPANVAHILRAFDRAAASENSAATQRAEIAAGRAYEAERARVTTMAREVTAEESRLSRTLG